MAGPTLLAPIQKTVLLPGGYTQKVDLWGHLSIHSGCDILRPALKSGHLPKCRNGGRSRLVISLFFSLYVSFCSNKNVFFQVIYATNIKREKFWEISAPNSVTFNRCRWISAKLSTSARKLSLEPLGKERKR